MSDVIPMPRRQPQDDTLVTAAEIAERWAVHRDTIYRIPPNELPYLKLGPNTRRYRWEDVKAYEESSFVGGD